MLWRATSFDGRTTVLFRLEFQSSVDYTMPVRAVEFALQIRRSIPREQYNPDGEVPPLVTIVIHHGPRRWTVATDTVGVFGSLRPGSEGGEAQAVGGVSARCCAPPGGARGSHDGGRPWYLVLDFSQIEPSEMDAGDMPMWMARFEQAETVSQLSELWLGLQTRLTGEGELALLDSMRLWIQRILLSRAGPPGQKLKLAISQGKGDDMPGLAQYTEEMWKEHDRKLLERGVEQGRHEGQVRVVCRQAKTKFGSSVAARLAEVLREVTDGERIGAVADSVLACESGEELIRLARAAV